MEYINQNEQNPAESRRNKTRKAHIALAIMIPAVWLLSMIAVALTAYWIGQMHRSKDAAMLAAVQDVNDVIRENYYFYDNDDSALMNAALKGITEGTGDEYAYYYTAEEYADLQKQNAGSFVGIGILTMKEEGGAVRIVDVYTDTPASEAGLLAGDQMIEINGVSYEGLDLSSFLGNVIAEDGAENQIKVLRDGQELSFTIIAREVHTPSVSYRMLNDNVGYIHISTFHGTCVDETETALQDLKEQGMTKLVLDLRDNLGGSLDDALDIADFFLPKDHVITSLCSRNGTEKTYYTKKDGMDVPIVLLTNGYSASASELVAGALKDYEVAHLIGTRTYGKGIVQSYFRIPETNGMLKITTEAYYTPNGICVHGDGIEPDEIVELSEEGKQYSISVLPYELDTQLQAAISYFESH